MIPYLFLIGVLLHQTVESPDSSTARDMLVWRPVFERIIRDNQFELREDMTGFVRSGDKEVRFELHSPSEVEWQGNWYLVGALLFSGEQTIDRQAFADGKVEIQERKYPDLLVVANRDKPQAVLTRLLAECSSASKVTALSVGDHMSRGDLQIAVRTTAVYYFNDPPEHKQVDRYMLFSFPDLDPIFAGTERVAIMGEDYGDRLIDRRISLGPHIEGEVRSIVLSSPDDGVIETIPYKNGRYAYSDELPWERKAEAVQARTPRSSEFNFRVVDEQGNPLPAIEMAAYDIGFNAFTWKTTSRNISGKTDKNGRFSGRVRNQLELNIKADGYYLPDKIMYNKEDIPSEEVVVVLRKYDTPVPTFTGFGQAIPSSGRSCGFHLVDSPGGGGCPKSFEGEADLWIRMTDVENSPDPIAFRLLNCLYRIEGGNGWELVPASQPWNDGKTMYVAPEEGYKESWEFLGSDMPEEFYLHNTRDNRYGKLFGLGIVSGGALTFGYLLQAEPVGTRSLNPHGFDMGEWRTNRRLEKQRQEERARKEQWYRSQGLELPSEN